MPSTKSIYTVSFSFLLIRTYPDVVELMNHFTAGAKRPSLNFDCFERIKFRIFWMITIPLSVGNAGKKNSNVHAMLIIILTHLYLTILSDNYCNMSGFRLVGNNVKKVAVFPEGYSKRHIGIYHAEILNNNLRDKMTRHMDIKVATGRNPVHVERPRKMFFEEPLFSRPRSGGLFET